MQPRGKRRTSTRRVEQARPGDTILIRHRGPLEMPPLEMIGKSPLTIVGDAQEGVEFWPLVVQGPPPLKEGVDPNAPAAAAAAMFHGEHMEITLKKLHLAVGGPGPRRGKLGAVFALDEGRIRIEQCSITVGSADQPGEPLGERLPLVRTTSGPEDAVELSLRQTYIRGARLAGCITSTGGGPVVLDAQQLLWAGGISPFVSTHDISGPLNLGVAQSTLYNVPSLLHWESASGGGKTFGEPTVRLAVSRSLIVGPYANKEPLVAWNPADSQADLVKAVAEGLVAWRGEGNVYHRYSGYYREPRSKSLASLTKWRTLWGQSGTSVDRESDPHFRVWPTDYLLQEANVWDYEPRFWRNREKSRQIAEGEAGAAVATLPPALPRAFDRQPVQPDLATKPRGTPRVLRVHQRDGPYKTIEAALADVRDGDIVEIADSGPYTPRRNFTLSPGDGVLTSPVDCLTIRAGKEASPLVILRDDVQEGPATNTQWLGGWLMFVAAQNRTSLQIDGLHFRLAASPAQISRTVLAVNTVGLLRTSNCSFTVPLPMPAQYIMNLPPVFWSENCAYLSTAGKNDVEMLRLDSSSYGGGGAMLWSVRNCLFNGHAFAHRSGNPQNRKKINLVLHGNTFLGRVAELLNGPTLASYCSENLVYSPDAVLKFDDDGIWRTAVKQGDRNALWIGTRTLTDAERSESAHSLLPGPVLKTQPVFETTTAARDPLRPFHVRRATVTAADGAAVGVRFDYLPELPPQG